MMSSYLFETCRGQFNWNKKYLKKKVNLAGHSHVCVSECLVQRM